MSTLRLALVAAFATVYLPCQSTVSVPLNYNWNGIAHAGETGTPDAANGFRSISDRALDFTGGVPADPLFTRFNVVSAPFVLDMVHLGNRNNVDNGNWAFEGFANGNNVGVQPNWLANPNQTTPQTTTLASPIPIGLNSSASILWHVTNGGGTCDVVFSFQGGGTRTQTIAAPDWFGGNHAGRDSVDAANPGANLNLQETVVDLSLDAGELLVSIAFANPSSSNAGYGFYAVNVEAGLDPTLVNNIDLDWNWNGIVHAGEDQQPDALNGYRSVGDRGLDFRAGVPSAPALSGFSFVENAGVNDCVMLGNRNTAAGGTLAFDAAADGDDLGVQPSWLPGVDLSGPQTTVLATPILLDSASSASFLFNMSHGGGAFDVTFTLNSGSVTATLRAPDWTNGGTFAGMGDTDTANPSTAMRIDSETVDLSPLDGFVLTAITFSNRSNTNGNVAILAANVTGCLACANAGGPVALGGGIGPTMSTTSTGALGCDLDWTVANANPSTLGAFVFGLGSFGVPLSIIDPGCSGTVYPVAPVELVTTVTDAFGSATFVLPGSLLTSPSICGAVITGQHVEFDFGGPCFALLSDAIQFTIGN